MKTMMYVGIIIASGFLGACTATVKTFDSGGQLLGSCEASRGLFFGGAHCGGSANPKEQK